MLSESIIETNRNFSQVDEQDTAIPEEADYWVKLLGSSGATVISKPDRLRNPYPVRLLDASF
jgi:hypothetical protein